MDTTPSGPPEPAEPAGPGPTREEQVAWGVASPSEHRVAATVAVLVAAAFQTVPDRVVHGLGPRWILPVLEGVLALVLLAASPRRITRESIRLRRLSMALIALVSVVNAVAVADLVSALVSGSLSAAGGRSLIYASIPVWLTNVIVFALWYWELDRGGPAVRLRADHRRPDFLFPQMATPGVAPGWVPKFVDYLYTSFTNATAFSPTDTMPVTAWAKLLMMLQSMVSLMIVVLVVSRAVNILK